MKKNLSVFMLIAVYSLTLAGCFQAPQEEQKQPEEKTEIKEEVTLQPTETVENVYKNTMYGYAFILPESWGETTQKEEGNVIHFTSEDGEKTLTLGNVKIDVINDAPQKLLMVTQKGYQIFRNSYEMEINIREGMGEDVSLEKELEEELKKIELTFYLIDDEGSKIVEGGGGVAADETAANYPEAPATIAEKLDDFEKYGTGYTGNIITGCNTEADELNKNLKSGGILAVQVYKSSYHDMFIYKTTNPEKMTKEQLEQIADSCAELGTNQVLKATEDYVLWGYPVCAAGALPDPELQPELYKDYFDCVKATDQVSAYFK